MRALGVSLLVALAACATIDPRKGHDEVGDRVKERTGFDTGWNQGTPDDAAVAKRVNDLLGQGLDRDRAVQIALVNNRELQSTYEELGVSQADMVQAGLLSNPRISGAFGTPIGGGAAIAELEGSLVMDFMSLFLLPLRRSVAAEAFAVSVARVANEALKVAAETAEHLAHVQAAQKQVDLRRVVAEAARGRAALAERQHHAGNITDLEFAHERATYAQARIDLAHAEQHLALEREELNELLGLFGEQTGWKLAAELAEPPEKEPDLGGLEARAIRQRMDLAAYRRGTALVRRMVAVARASRVTGIFEIGVDIHQDPDGPLVAGPNLTLELPIFDQRTAYIAGLEAQQRQAERQLAGAGVRVRAEVRKAKARYVIARDMIESYRRSLMPLRERVLSETQLQYNAMQLGFVQLAEAKREQTEAYGGYIEALAEYWASRAELERAIGGPLERAVVAAPEKR